MTTDTFCCGGTPVSADLYSAAGPAKGALLYFHGGGLLYGERKDLPSAYIKAITARGYHLVCLDYLLAPESDLSQIHASVDLGLEWFLHLRNQELGSCPFALFGRSAGAYLALCLAHRLSKMGGQQPAALWAFYGYHTLLHPFFSGPSAHYRTLPMVPASMVPDLRNAPAVSAAPIEQRFFLYVHARQQGKWLDLLAPDPAQLTCFSIPEEDLNGLPPTFLTASTADQDVPFSFSKKLSLQIPKNQFLPVFGLEHDYDRNPALPESQRLYQTALDWTDSIFIPHP